MVVGDECVHGTCVAFGNRAVLITGPSGAGKSDLALRLIFAEGLDCLTEAPGRLVADDQVVLSKRNQELFAAPPQSIVGKLEIRGIGIVELDFVANVKLCLVVRLVPSDDVPRMPKERCNENLLGVSLPLVRLLAHEPSTPIKVAIALSRI